MWQVVGHGSAVSLLDRARQNGHLAHAYLLLGPAQVGKMTLAMDLARAINCEHPDPPCGSCRSCRQIAEGNHPDVQVIGLLADERGGETRVHKEISIDQVRTLQHDAQLRPYVGRYRVFILDAAERLSLPAANALLKTLEEPPAHVVLLLLAVNDKLLPPTVVSRCQRLELRPLPAGEVERALIERWGAEPARARLLASLSGGRLGWAVVALGDDRVLAQREERLRELAGLLEKGRAERFAYASTLATRFTRDRAAGLEVLDLWIGWWRDLLLQNCGCGDLMANQDCVKLAARQASAVSAAQIRQFLDDLQETVRQLGQNVNPRLALEVLMLRLPHAGNLVMR